MAAFIDVKVQRQDFDVGEALASLRANNPQVGALVNFVGVVRDFNDGQRLATLELEHYPGMTERSIEAIVEQACQRWPLMAALVIHRVGKLAPSDQIVMVAVSAMHRGEAFAGCEFIMDYLKTQAPFWKKELGSNGSRWVDARLSDHSAADRWTP